MHALAADRGALHLRRRVRRDRAGGAARARQGARRGARRQAHLPAVHRQGGRRGAQEVPDRSTRRSTRRTQEIVLRKRYHIGIAAATADGLIVPVVKRRRSEVALRHRRDVDELSEKTRAGKATRDELTGSTFTITSLGALGGVLATPIINFPEVAILGVHKIKADAGGARRADRHPRHDEPLDLARSPHRRRLRGRACSCSTSISLLEDPTLMFMEMV